MSRRRLSSRLLPLPPQHIQTCVASHPPPHILRASSFRDRSGPYSSSSSSPQPPFNLSPDAVIDRVAHSPGRNYSATPSMDYDGVVSSSPSLTVPPPALLLRGASPCLPTDSTFVSPPPQPSSRWRGSVDRRQRRSPSASLSALPVSSRESGVGGRSGGYPGRNPGGKSGASGRTSSIFDSTSSLFFIGLLSISFVASVAASPSQSLSSE